jgi:serine/threonine protein phosphatase PrpC
MVGSGKLSGLGAKERGALHTRRGQPLQDDWRLEQCGDGLVFAVADGHGSSKRAEVGAKAAVDSAIAIFCEEIERRGSIAALLSDARNAIHLSGMPPLSVEITSRIATRWWDLIQEQVADSGLTLLEMREYGSTLIAGVANDDDILILQVGDGDAVLIQQGTSDHLRRPGACAIGDETYSLSCEPERHAFGISKAWSGDSSLLMVCTDGFSKSYPSDESFLDAASGYLTLMNQHDHNAVENWLPSYLAQITTEGAGDDIAAILIYRSNDSDVRRRKPESALERGDVPECGDISLPAPSFLASIGQGSATDLRGQENPVLEPPAADEKLGPVMLPTSYEGLVQANHVACGLPDSCGGTVGRSDPAEESGALVIPLNIQESESVRDEIEDGNGAS